MKCYSVYPEYNANIQGYIREVRRTIRPNIPKYSGDIRANGLTVQIDFASVNIPNLVNIPEPPNI